MRGSVLPRALHAVPLHEEQSPVEILCIWAVTAVFLVLFAGLMSGLTLGLLSMEEFELRVVEKTGSECEKRNATKVKGLIRNQHWLLVTLLLGNAIVLETLPLVLDKLVSSWVAILLSVFVVLFFAEIFPMAVCKAKGLAIGAAAAPLVILLMWVFSPIAYPVAKFLDWLLGHEGVAHQDRVKLAAEAQVRRELGDLTPDEEKVICGALELSRKACTVCMTPLEKVAAIAEDAKFDTATLDWILQSGHSRIPVHSAGNPSDLHSVLLVKTLLDCNPADGVLISSLKLSPIVFAGNDTGLYHLLNLFQAGQTHLAAIFPDSTSKCATGIITLEDVIEELMQKEIVDETDQFVHAEEPTREFAEGWRLRHKSEHSWEGIQIEDDISNENLVH